MSTGYRREKDFGANERASKSRIHTRTQVHTSALKCARSLFPVESEFEFRAQSTRCFAQAVIVVGGEAGA